MVEEDGQHLELDIMFLIKSDLLSGILSIYIHIPSRIRIISAGLLVEDDLPSCKQVESKLLHRIIAQNIGLLKSHVLVWSVYSFKEIHDGFSLSCLKEGISSVRSSVRRGLFSIISSSSLDLCIFAFG